METLSDLELEEFELENKGISVKDVKLPYVIKNHTLFTPGVHNNVPYSAELIKNGFYNTQWNDRTTSLYHAHKDEFAYNPRTGQKDLHVGAEVDDLAGYVSNLKYLDGGVIKGDLNITDLSTAIKLMLGAHIGVSPRGVHNLKKRSMIIENWALTVNPAIKTTYIHSEQGIHSEHPGTYAFAMSEINTNEVKTMGDETTETPKTVESPKTAEEQLKELKAEMEELKKKIKEYPEVKDEKEELKKKEEEELKKKKDEEELKKKYPEEKYPEEEKEQSEEIDEELMDMVNSMTTEELSSWKNLVKKYGVKEAKKIYKKEKDVKKASEQSEKLETLEKSLSELKEKLAIPEILSPSNQKMEGEIQELTARQADEGMLEYVTKLMEGE